MEKEQNKVLKTEPTKNQQTEEEKQEKYKKMGAIKARNFTASLKPAWTNEQIKKLCNDMTGTAEVWGITHDLDTNDNGELVEPHTHLVILYKNPRNLSTVANLLNVKYNFIEKVQSKYSILKYLTHLNFDDKTKYEPDQIITNSKVDYITTLKGLDLSNREIAELLQSKYAIDLLDMVEPNKLRAIQSLMHFDQNDAQINELRHVNARLEEQSRLLSEISNRNLQMVQQLTDLISDFGQFRDNIVKEISKLPDLTKQFATGLLGGIDNLTLQLKNVALVGVGQKPDFL